jgi:glutaminase
MTVENHEIKKKSLKNKKLVKSYAMIKYYRKREVDQKDVEDILFDMFTNESTGLLSIGKFLAALRTTGIRRTDPRIHGMMENLRKVHKTNNYEGGSPETQNLNRETFKA